MTSDPARQMRVSALLPLRVVELIDRYRGSKSRSKFILDAVATHIRALRARGKAPGPFPARKWLVGGKVSMRRRSPAENRRNPLPPPPSRDPNAAFKWPRAETAKLHPPPKRKPAPRETPAE